VRAAGDSLFQGEYDVDTGDVGSDGAGDTGAGDATGAAPSIRDDDGAVGAYSGCSLFRAAGDSALHGEYDFRGDTGASAGAAAAGATSGAAAGATSGAAAGATSGAAGAGAAGAAAGGAAASGFGDDDGAAGAYSGCSLLRAEEGDSALHGEYDF